MHFFEKARHISWYTKDMRGRLCMLIHILSWMGSEWNNENKDCFSCFLFLKRYKEWSTCLEKMGNLSDTGRVGAAREPGSLEKGCLTWLTPWHHAVLGGKKQSIWTESSWVYIKNRTELREAGIHLTQRTDGYPSWVWASIFWRDQSSWRHLFVFCSASRRARFNVHHFGQTSGYISSGRAVGGFSRLVTRQTRK